MKSEQSPKVETFKTGKSNCPFNDVNYKMLRLAFIFKTRREHELIRRWAKKQTVVRKIVFS